MKCSGCQQDHWALEMTPGASTVLEELKVPPLDFCDLCKTLIVLDALAGEKYMQKPLLECGQGISTKDLAVVWKLYRSTCNCVDCGSHYWCGAEASGDMPELHSDCKCVVLDGYCMRLPCRRHIQVCVVEKVDDGAQCFHALWNAYLTDGTFANVFDPEFKFLAQLLFGGIIMG